MDKKAKECKSSKLRARKAEKELKLVGSILTQSQIEELRRCNVVVPCNESSVQLNASADSSLESFQTMWMPHDHERHLTCATTCKEQYEVGESV